MIPKTNSYHLSLKGMIYLLFKKKRCPLCKGKLIKTTEKEYTGLEKEYVLNNLNTPYTENYDVHISYNCNFCNTRYSLEELAGDPVNHSKDNKKSLEEIKASDEKLRNKIEKYKKLSVFIMRFLYLIFFVVAIFVFFLAESIIPFLMIFPAAIILMISFEWAIRK